MSRLLYRLGHWCGRHRWWVVAAWVVIAVVLVVLAGRAGERTTENFDMPGTDSQRATDVIDQRFPDQSGTTTSPVLVKAPSGKLTDSENAKAVNATVAELRKADKVIAVVSPISAVGRESGDLSKDGTIGQIQVTQSVDPAEVTDREAESVDDALRPARAAGLQAVPGGIVGAVLSSPDAEFAEAVGLAAAVIVLLAALGTAVAMITPIFTAIFGLATALSIITLLEHVLQIPSVAPSLAIMIGLGVGIDYALFLLNRHRAGTRAGLPPREAAARAVATTGSAIVFAGGTVVIAICSVALVGLPGINSLGYTASVAVAVAVLAAITLLPAVLNILGRRLESLRLPGRRRDTEALKADELRQTRWAKWGMGVANHPWIALVVALAILIPLAIPVLSMELGQDDAGGQPKDTYARQAFDLTTEGFGVGENGPLLVAGTLGGGAGERQADEAAVDRLHDEAARDPGVVAVTPPVYNQQRSAVYFSVIPTTRPQADETEDLVHRLRDDLISAAEKGNSLDASVGGVTAAQIDLAARIADRLPLVIAAVIALSFLLLMTAFRSLLIPLKAGLMNLLAVGAAYGVLVAVFQWGWGAELIGLEGATPITSFIPLMMFAILFGLSMDYEVFLMSQIRERHEMGEDTHDSVAHGLALSGRVITAAALIMVCVFSAFMLVGDPTIKQFGLGMAVAVAIDATIVRCLLVPSLMVLMRNGNWYFPKWLDRVLPRMNVEGEAALRDSGALNDEAALAGAKVP